jgi:hypothetical protein
MSLGHSRADILNHSDNTSQHHDAKCSQRLREDDDDNDNDDDDGDIDDVKGGLGNDGNNQAATPRTTPQLVPQATRPSNCTVPPVGCH